MTEPIWKKTGGGAGPGKAIMAFLAGEDVLLDRQLISYDIQASCAHVQGLAMIDVLSGDEAQKIQAALVDIGNRLDSGDLELDDRFEDGHSALEAWLTEMLGPLGGKVHTGRSRNDQVAVALRLYMKDALACLATSCQSISEVALECAHRDGDLVMPGYTHMQRAMPSTVGLWLAGHAEAFIDNAELAWSIRKWLDASPLGTASGFGINLALERQAVAGELDFDRLVINPQYAQNSRGKIELQVLSALGAATGDLRRLAWDLSLFTTSEFNFIRLPDGYCTGSSIMPNKRNPDVVELLRASHAVVVGARTELESVLSLPSGYQRDLQATKPPLLRAFSSGLQSLALLPALIADLQWNKERMKQAISPDMLATDLSVELALEGKPFRQAYRDVAARIDELDAGDLEKSLGGRVSPGASAALMLDDLQARLDAIPSRE